MVGAAFVCAKTGAKRKQPPHAPTEQALERELGRGCQIAITGFDGLYMDFEPRSSNPNRCLDFDKRSLAEESASLRKQVRAKLERCSPLTYPIEFRHVPQFGLLLDKSTRELFLDALDVGASSSIDLKQIALVDKKRHVDDGAGLDRRGLGDIAG